ncbi:hypothetical protein HK414_14865 [Ramlibacter terrae]|uniref:Uncharacterized protein n=1 Tax=Ramlibacter terrae TaxID=2732511 RepID=A0ABX6P334_9BURK|nr:hypothetical protein HK414_14865 [Ramlibacter terrae]
MQALAQRGAEHGHVLGDVAVLQRVVVERVLRQHGRERIERNVAVGGGAGVGRLPRQNDVAAAVARGGRGVRGQRQALAGDGAEVVLARDHVRRHFHAEQEGLAVGGGGREVRIAAEHPAAGMARCEQRAQPRVHHQRDVAREHLAERAQRAPPHDFAARPPRSWNQSSSRWTPGMPGCHAGRPTFSRIRTK